MRRFRILCLALLMAGGTASADTYPEKSRPIKIVVPFGTGSSTDNIARAFGRALGEQAGVTVVVENKPGAEGVIGVQAVKNAPPDGYTILLGNSSTHVLNAHVLPKLPYDPAADFVPITGVAKFTLVMNAGPSTSFKTAREFIEGARSNPGKFSYGSGTASTRLAMEMLEHLAGVMLLAVPYKALGDATTALAAGEIDVVMNDAVTAAPYYKTGRVRPLGVTGSERMTAFPKVPTLREQGVDGYELTGWFATYFPAKTPPDRVKAMRDMLRKAARTQYVADALAAASFEPLDMDGAQLAALQHADIEKWGKLLSAMKAKSR